MDRPDALTFRINGEEGLLKMNLFIRRKFFDKNPQNVK